MQAILVVNQAAGRVRGAARGERIEERLRSAGLDVLRVDDGRLEGIVARVGSALRGAQPEQTRVVVAGGDGTIHSVLPAVRDTGVPLAILPVGSVNVLARELGIPLSLEAAIEVAATGEVRQIDLGVANGRPFALMAGLGFDAEVVHSVAQSVKNALGSFAYVARGLELLRRYPASVFRIAADGEVLETTAWLAVVANASRYTYRWHLSPEARIDDGWLDLCLFQSNAQGDSFRQAAAALVGKHTLHPGILHLKARRFEFRCDPSVALQLDGDPAGRSPVEIEIAPGALTVVTPQRS